MRPKYTLQEVCSIKITDGTHQTPTYCGEKEGIPFISSKDVTKQYIDWEGGIKYIPQSLHEELYKRIAPQKDDVLLAKNGTTGVAAIVEDDRIFDIYVTLAVLRPNQKIITPRFLHRIVNSPICKRQFDKSLKGAGVPNLHLENIKKVEIPLPPLETQKAIVAKLDQIFAELDQTKSEIQKNLDNTDELWKSALNQAFQGDWEMKKLGEVGSLTRGKGFLKGDFVEDGFPCIHYGQIHMKFDTAIDKNITYIPEELAKKSGIAEKNDIIIVITSEDVEGSCKSIAWLGNYPVAVGAHAAIYKHTQNPLYISYYLQSSMFFKQKINYTHGSKVVEIKPIDVGNCTIPVPPLSEQEKIVEHLDQVSKEVKALKSQYQSQLDHLEELKKSVLDKAFRGEMG